MKSLLSYFALCFLILISSCKKDEPEKEPVTSAPSSLQGSVVFDKSYNGSYNYDETAHTSVIESSDGNYVLLGTKYDGQSDNISITKTSLNGSVLWQKQFGGTAVEKAGSLISTSDGNILAIGTTTTNPFNWVETKAFIIKLNQAGDTLWSKILGNWPQDEGYLVCESGGGYTAILKGESVYTPIKLIRMDINGDSLWTSNITQDSSHFVEPNDVLSDVSGNYIICGESSSGGHSMFVTKVNSIGIVSWKKNLFSSDYSSLKKIIQAPNGNYLCVGYSENSTSFQKNVFVVILDPNGNEVSRKVLAIAGEASSAVITPDGGYLINTFDESIGVVILKTDNNFNVQWKITTISSNSESIIKTSTGDYIATYSMTNAAYYLELHLMKLHLN